MFCKNCGSKLDDDAVFCEKCGTAIKRTASLDSAKDSIAQESSSNNQISNESANENPTATVAKPKSRRIVALVAALAVIVFVAIFFALNKSTFGVSDPRVESNFNNGGKLAFDDKALYFIGLYDENDSETCVYSTSYTGTNKSLVSSNPNISRIRIANGKILYATYEDDTYKIGLMGKDGSDDNILVELTNDSDNYLNDFSASDTTLYYLYNDELRMRPMNDGEDTLLLDNVEDFILAGDTIYYATESSIFSYDIKKTESVEICSSEAYNLVLCDEKIYFKNDNGIYRVSLTGKESAELIVKDSKVGNFVIDGDNIYYLQTLETDEITELAKYIDEDEYFTYALAMIGSGQIKRVPKAGGPAESVDSNQPLSTALFVYPDGMYSRTSIFSDTLSLVEFE